MSNICEMWIYIYIYVHMLNVCKSNRHLSNTFIYVLPTYTCYLHIYTYTEKERERDRQGQSERERARYIGIELGICSRRGIRCWDSLRLYSRGQIFPKGAPQGNRQAIELPYRAPINTLIFIITPFLNNILCFYIRNWILCAKLIFVATLVQYFESLSNIIGSCPILYVFV